MSKPSTVVKSDNLEFDVAGVGDWLVDNVEFALVLALIAFIFYLFQKGGFAEKLLQYRLEKQRLEAQQKADLRAIAEAFHKKFETDSPLLPFDELKDEEDKT